MKYKKYRRTNIAEMRPCNAEDIYQITHNNSNISVSKSDIENGSPKLSDMIAKNPLNYKDKWLVAKKYFMENFEEV